MAKELTKEFGDLDFWINRWLAHRRRSSHNTKIAYSRNIQKFIQSINKQFDQVSVQDILDYQESISDDYAERSCAQITASIRSFYNYLNKREVTSLNLALVETGSVKIEVDPSKLLTVKEVEALVEASKPDQVANLFIRLLYLTGARKSEILNLRWRDLHPSGDGGSAAIMGKGQKRRNVFVKAELWQDLLTARGGAGEDDLLFPTLDSWEAWSLVKKLADVAKISEYKNPTVHSFRHACASHLLEAGADPVAVRDLLGHASIEMTNHYLHASSKRSPVELLTVK